MPSAQGKFTIAMQPLPTPPAPGMARFSFEKVFEGDMQGTSTGEMISAGNPHTGSAGYVAMELFTGTLHGKQGTFILQHGATMQPESQMMRILPTPGAGTGELSGISGQFTIVRSDHSYEFLYDLPS